MLLQEAVPEMEAATHSPEPAAGLKTGLEKINDHLESVGTLTGSVSKIVETVGKIASAAGLAIKVVAPFLAGLL